MWYSKYGVVLIEEPHAMPGPSPTLETLHRIEMVLRRAAEDGEAPLSYAEIERRLPTKKIRRTTLKACLTELHRFHLISEDDKGVMWVFMDDDDLLNRPTVPLA